jgi:glycosyltransferase involved in cell wall biosynthesis
MRIAIVADTFPPLRTSGAIQLRDLSREFTAQGHEITMLVSSPDISTPHLIEAYGDVTVLRLRAPQTKDIGYFQRTINEFLAPFTMIRNLKKSPLANVQYEAIIWYSPSIFLGPIVKTLKSLSECPSYLIIRDIFPQWAADMGLMSRGIAYQILSLVARFQYSAADVIGVQTPGNLAFLQSADAGHHRARLEVLHNWLGAPANTPCSIDITQTKLSGRRVFVYAGNMGVAQGMEKLLKLARMLRERSDIGFLFVGRGSMVEEIAKQVQAEKLNNVLFYDEIDPDEIPALYSQCEAGLVSLDPRHTTHNIPGKFLSYMQAGLPVLASVNAGNDLVDIVKQHNVGRISVDPNGDDLAAEAIALMNEIKEDTTMKERCRILSSDMFSAGAAVRQIVSAIGAA